MSQPSPVSSPTPAPPLADIAADLGDCRAEPVQPTAGKLEPRPAPLQAAASSSVLPMTSSQPTGSQAPGLLQSAASGTSAATGAEAMRLPPSIAAAHATGPPSVASGMPTLINAASLGALAAALGVAGVNVGQLAHLQPHPRPGLVGPQPQVNARATFCHLQLWPSSVFLSAFSPCAHLQ